MADQGDMQLSLLLNRLMIMIFLGVNCLIQSLFISFQFLYFFYVKNVIIVAMEL